MPWNAVKGVNLETYAETLNICRFIADHTSLFSDGLSIEYSLQLFVNSSNVMRFSRAYLFNGSIICSLSLMQRENDDCRYWSRYRLLASGARYLSLGDRIPLSN